MRKFKSILIGTIYGLVFILSPFVFGIDGIIGGEIIYKLINRTIRNVNETVGFFIIGVAYSLFISIIPLLGLLVLWIVKRTPHSIGGVLSTWFYVLVGIIFASVVSIMILLWILSQSSIGF